MQQIRMTVTVYKPFKMRDTDFLEVLLVFSINYIWNFRPLNLPTLVSSHGVFVAISKRAENLSQLISTQMRHHNSHTLILIISGTQLRFEGLS